MSRAGALRGAVLLLALAMLAACAPRTAVRVEPVDRPRSAAPRAAAVPAGSEYRVQRGDTLYGIAFRHGMDYRQLAQLNGIGAPYTIYPGQRLQLSASPAVAARRGGRTPARSAAPARAVVAPIAAGPAPAAAPSRPGATQSGAAPSNVAALPPPAPATAPSNPTARPASLPSGAPRWRWPADGAIVGRFAANDPTRQGLNIAGSAGNPVRAAADGVVVYSGSGLIGYGELVIVKHSDEWLSAYGHNRKRLVAEGQAVSAGQQIAEMGRSGASRDMLHFEIRRNGRPVDPAGLLPGR